MTIADDVKGRLAGAIKQWDSDDNLTEDNIDEMAQLYAEHVESYVTARFSASVIEDLQDE